MKKVLTKIPLFFIISTGLIFILSFSCSKRKAIEAPNIVPSAPTGLTILNQTATTVTLSWEFASDKDGQVIGYNIYYSPASGQYSQKANTDLVKSTNYTVTGLMSGYIYYFIIRTVDNNGTESLNSMEVSVTGNVSISGIINYPVNSSMINSLSQIDLTFSNNVTGADIKTNYVFSGSGVGTLAVSNVVFVTGTTYRLTITGTPANGNAALTMSNIKDIGNNPISNNVINFVFDVSAPVTGASGVITGNNVTSTSFTLNWTAASDNMTSQNFLLYKVVKASLSTDIDTIAKADAITGSGLIQDWAFNLNSMNITGLSGNTTYYFAILVKDNVGNKSMYALKQQSTIYSAGTIDTLFNPGTGADGTIYSMTIQSDGKIIIGGNLSSYNGISRNRIVRINPDGTIDTSFNPGTGADGKINSVVVQSDGKILIGGEFTNYNGTSQGHFARLNSDGSIDAGFNSGTSANGNVLSIAVQSDGKILISGNFFQYNGINIYNIARINSDGTIDSSFNPGVGLGYSGSIYSNIVQPDGKIIIVGSFTKYNNVGRNTIARINSDGTIDMSFDPGSGTASIIIACALQNDGKILIVGDFIAYNGTNRNRIARINSDGSIDLNFNPGSGVDNTIITTAVQSDGKVLIGGIFSQYSGINRHFIARINSDGTIDSNFNPGSGTDNNGTIWNIQIQSDGKILLGGQFTTYNGTSINRIARIWDVEH